MRVGAEFDFGRHRFGSLGTADHLGGALWFAVGAVVVDARPFRLDVDVGARAGVLSLRASPGVTSDLGDDLVGWYLAPLARVETSWGVDRIRVGLVAEVEWVHPELGVVGYVARGFARSPAQCSSDCEAVGLTGFSTLAGVRVGWSR